MALNSVFEAKRKPSVRAVSEDHASSFFSESQTSWVVFNPGEQIFNDVLSFSTRSRVTEYEDSHLEDTLEQSHTQAQGPEDASISSSRDSLSSRINAWQKATDTEISDNVASWDLDADLTTQHEATPTQQLRQVRDFYGGDLLRNMPHDMQLQVRRSSARLKSSLTRKGYRQHHPDLLAKLLGLLRWQELLKSPGSLVDDYVANTLSRANFNPSLARYERDYSDTASSSAVMCGGGNSWNDL